MISPGTRIGLGEFVRFAAARGELVVQPRMGMSDPAVMAAGMRAVAEARVPAAVTMTLDSYTRVGDHDGARRALARGDQLNGFPIVHYGPEVAARVAAAVEPGIPIQVRHGSARPAAIFDTMAAAGLADSEGGPVSYCLPYGRTPLAESVARWAEATEMLAETCSRQGTTAHLETFGGCLLGQLCPPSLLVAMSVLEGLFFARHGVTSVSLSYAQQTDQCQDIEALAALRYLASRMLPPGVDWHVVVYTYMGMYPRTGDGARRLLAGSVDVATRGRAERLIVKTAAEAHRIPTVEENVAALEGAASRAGWARTNSDLPTAEHVDFGDVLAEAQAMVDAVLQHGDDIGSGLLAAFAAGRLDVPFCIHPDNAGRTQAAIDDGGRLVWTRTGRLPLPGARPLRGKRVSSGHLLRMLRFTAEHNDRAADQGAHHRIPKPLPAASATR